METERYVKVFGDLGSVSRVKYCEVAVGTTGDCKLLRKKTNSIRMKTRASDAR